MKLHITVLASSLALAMPALAKDIPLSQAESIAKSVTPDSASVAFNDLEAQWLTQLRKALQGDTAALTRDALAQMRQNSIQADNAWLQASGYDFQTTENQQMGITLLSAFNTLPEAVLKDNLATVTAINHDADVNTRHQALADAESVEYLYFLSDAMGPRLGRAFLAAYDKGELGKAAALIKASEVSTGAVKKYFHYPRPYQVPGNTIHLTPDDVVVKDGHPYTAGGGAFPSGHTNTGYTDALLMAEMIPERFDALVIRGARMVAQRNVAHYLNDPYYRTLFNEARAQLREALVKECGTTIVECAASAGKDDPYRDPAMHTFYRFTMTYNLPQQKGEHQPLKIPKGADVLLQTALPNLSPAQRQALMEETALPAGYPLSGETEDQQFWQRLDLSAAYEMARKTR
ncbi:phosphatase PAP2 family protein [Salmonella enterica]|nr:phosphatase PAP2 family protein [Salmonella enterica]EJM0842890.1 phosphatase PAP2 family protein [Salmonella enterica]EJS1670800.1 phosphatase PAP2 family protein [Salmonella enterica]